MFLWTDSRIEGHIELCYIFFYLFIFLQNKCGCGEQGEHVIQCLLSKMDLSEIVQDGEVLWLILATSEQIERLLKLIHSEQLHPAISDATIASHLPYDFVGRKSKTLPLISIS